MHEYSYELIFGRYGGIMRTCELTKEGISYQMLRNLIEQGKVEKRRVTPPGICCKLIHCPDKGLKELRAGYKPPLQTKLSGVRKS